MSRIPSLNSPLLLGFEHFERTLDRISKMPSEGYPPYNIEQIGDDRLRITLAVAGFSDGDLSVELADDQLIVKGRQADAEEDGERVFLYRGIAARQFQRSFVLAEGLVVDGAELDNGLLHIDLRRPYVEPRVQSIAIKRPGSKGKAAKTVDVAPEEQV